MVSINTANSGMFILSPSDDKNSTVQKKVKDKEIATITGREKKSQRMIANKVEMYRYILLPIGTI